MSNIINITDCCATDISTDGTFSSPSDTQAPSTLAVKTYVDNEVGEIPIITINTDDEFTTPLDTEVPSSLAVKTYVDNAIDVASPFTFKKMLSNLATTSNTVSTSITDLSISVVSGKSYRIYADLIGQSAATTTGFTIGMIALDSAAGNVSFTVHAGNNSAEGAAGEHQGRLRSLTNNSTGLFQGGQVAEANQNCRIGIVGIFDCTTSGTICPAFRSEISGSQVTIYAGSIIEAIEL